MEENKYLVFDGETTNTPRNEKGQLDTSAGQVYDLGGQVIGESGKIYDHFNLINEDVFYKMPYAMREAYYKDKMPQYVQEIKEGKRQVVNTWQMWHIFNQMCKTYNVIAVVAHNIKFDIATLNATMRYQTKSKKRFFLPYGMPILDSMKMANEVIGKTKEYIDFCTVNNYMTNHPIPRPRLTAEVLYRFLTNNNTFEEAHTGLADVQIESEIFLECLRRGASVSKKKVR